MQPKGTYREMTWVSVLLGALFGAILNAGICYAGLQIGFTIVGSTVAAVVGFGVLRGILRKGSILEVNIFQSVASTVNTVNAGIIFTVPVLLLLGLKEEINFPALVLASIAGAVLGNVVIIPLRKQIIDFERLRFPEGVAVAAILKSPGAGVHKAVLLLGATLVAALIQVLVKDWTGGEKPLLPEEIHLGRFLYVPAGFRLVLAVSTLSLGAGYLAGRPGLVVLYGTLLNFWVLIPLCLVLGWVPAGFDDYSPWSAGESERAAWYARANEFAGAFSKFTSRNVGIGMILGGAVAGLLIALPALRSAIASLRSVSRTGQREEMPMGVLNAGLAVGLILLFLAAKLAGGEHVGWGTALVLTLAGGVWLWLAGIVVAQTTGRTDWSPLSGLALIAIAIMMGIMGTGREYVVPAVTIGAAICVATSMCADMMADLKTGYLVGSLPIKQQIAQLATCWIGPGIAVATTMLLWNVYAFGPNQAEVLYERAAAAGDTEMLERLGDPPALPEGWPKLGAPQAGALQSAIDIVQSGNVPLGKYITGAALGLLASLLVSAGMGVMVGLSMYLPFEYMFVFGIGGIANILVKRRFGAQVAEDLGVPIAAGLIVGEALVGVTHALVKVLGSL